MPGFFPTPSGEKKIKKRFSPAGNENSGKQIVHSLDGWKIDNYNVAKFYNISPEEIDNWTNINFLDRQEYMYICQHYENEEYKKMAVKNGK